LDKLRIEENSKSKQNSLKNKKRKSLNSIYKTSRKKKKRNFMKLPEAKSGNPFTQP
jgi:hypothetical protein